MRIVVPNAHDPIITKDQYQTAQDILGKRSAEIGGRASNPSEYALTGKIRCPECGRRFVGAAAHGRSARYRYYVCWGRARYGPKAGCGIYRFNADDLEAAISAAMIDFYANEHDVINEAVAEAAATYTKTAGRQRDQLAAVTRELKDAGTAIDRYLAAFERGTLDDGDEHVQARLATLKEQTKRLRTRKA